VRGSPGIGARTHVIKRAVRWGARTGLAGGPKADRLCGRSSCPGDGENRTRTYEFGNAMPWRE
jgi:hypothetical protein